MASKMMAAKPHLNPDRRERVLVAFYLAVLTCKRVQFLNFLGLHTRTYNQSLCHEEKQKLCVLIEVFKF